MEGNRVAGVVTESKSGREAILAKIVVDATGDGDVAYRAGAEFQLGREGDGAMQPVTLMFRIGGVDGRRWRDGSGRNERQCGDTVVLQG